MPSNFSEQFHHYLPPDSGAVKTAMTSGLVVLDTNILLNAYRFAPNARKQLMSVLTRVSDRTWIPHRVAEEFHKNRLAVMADYDVAYVSVIEPLKAMQHKLEEDIAPAIRQLANRTALTHEERDHLLKLVGSCTKPAMSAVESLRQGHHLDDRRTSDLILGEYQSLYDSKVGPPFDTQEYSEALKEAQRRIDNKIPPGYRDSKKEEPFGDYFIWRQTLTEAAKRKISWLLFITADTKEDWYQQIKGNTICARPELAKELMDYAGTRLVMLSLSSFFFHAREHLDAEISSETIRQSEQAAYVEMEIRYSQTAEALGKSRTMVDTILRDLGASEAMVVNLRSELDAALLNDPNGSAPETRIIRERIDKAIVKRRLIQTTLQECQAETAHLEQTQMALADRMARALPRYL